MKPKILIKVVDNGTHGDFTLEYPDHETLQRNLEQALPKLIEGGIFYASKLEFPLRIGGVAHQFTAPVTLERFYFPGSYTVQRCLEECKERHVEVVSYTLNKKATHEFLVRFTRRSTATPPMVAVDEMDDAPMAMKLPESYHRTVDAHGKAIHVGCGGVIVNDRCCKCQHTWTSPS